jgi:hypothetical protein
MLEDYKGIYFIGWFQPRGGVGSLMGPYADLLAEMLLVQEKFTSPLGQVFKKMGEKQANTHLFGGPEFLAWIKAQHKKIPNMIKIGKALDAQQGVYHNPLIP